MESDDRCQRRVRAQLCLAESSVTSEQRDASARLSEDARLRGELAACLARETDWKNELHTSKLEIQQFSTEADALQNHTLF